MSVLLLTMGPQLGVVMETPVLRVGEAGTIKFHAPGAVGPVKWSVVESDLPAEWGAITPDGADATINTAEALEWGEYTITVRAVDSQRVPVMRTFSVWVEPEDITVAAGGTQEWVVGDPVSLPLAITGGTGVYVKSDIYSGTLPNGIGAQVSGSTLQISGTPTSIGGDTTVITVADSRGAQGATSLIWEVTSPPKILLTCTGTTINGVTVPNFARLNYDGSIDGSFMLPVVTGGTISGFALGAGGKIYILGTFTGVNGVARTSIARLNYDGSLDTSFDANILSGTPGLLEQEDGRILLFGGSFTLSGGESRRHARLLADGTFDATYVGGAAANTIQTAIQLPDGRYLMGGLFNTINGSGGVGNAGYKLALLHGDGSLDTSFISGITGTNVLHVSRQADGKILVAGDITAIAGHSASRYARLNADFTRDTSFDVRGNNNAGRYIAESAHGGVYAFGSNSSFWNGASYVARRPARLDSATGFPDSFNLASGTIPQISSYGGISENRITGDVVIGGAYGSSLPSNVRLVIVTRAGVSLAGFTPPVFPDGTSSYITSVAIQYPPT